MPPFSIGNEELKTESGEWKVESGIADDAVGESGVRNEE